ncbi:Methylated-DNA--protein-cysteine methyltransferase [Paenibacillus sediminis]|uniref:Methylated-DNA--protein-cysteine methyltransferase n=1 Tax=Paenibacillus sediminis TaxID=664909 RepID=A0ABS4H668_9BACL|nr:O-6-methylguanine DNA methyltransferase [Paenibacillus sediminis]
MTIWYEEMETPIGLLTVCATSVGLCHIEFGSYADNLPVLELWAKRWFREVHFIRSAERLEKVMGQLNQYFAGELLHFDIPLDMQGTPFQLKVWEALRTIPYGEIRSYKQLAETIGKPKAVRAVGGANNRNPLPIIIPCHRVIGVNGQLVGYAGGLQVKEKLLEIEGVR